MKTAQALFIDLILTGAGVMPQVPNPKSLVYGEPGFNPEIHLMVGQNAYNVDDNILYKRSKNGIIKTGWLSDAERSRLMTAAERSKLAGIENNANNYIHPSTHGADIITETADKKVMTAAERSKLAGIANNANNYVHPSTHGADIITETADKKVMTAAERSKLAGIENNANNYVHPSTHGADIITETADKKVMTAAERSKLAGIANNANNYTLPAENVISTQLVEWANNSPKPFIETNNKPVSGEFVEGEKHFVLHTDKAVIIRILNRKKEAFNLPCSPDAFLAHIANKVLIMNRTGFNSGLESRINDGNIDESFDIDILQPLTNPNQGTIISEQETKTYLLYGNINTCPGINIVRLNSNGSQVGAVSINMCSPSVFKNNDYIYVAGQWRRHDNILHFIARLNQNLTLDETHHANIGNDGFGYVYTLVPVENGKVFANGSFTESFVLLNDDGSIDTDFSPAITSFSNTMYLSKNGKLLLINTPSHHFVEMNQNGSIFSSANIIWGETTPFSFNGIHIINGKIIISNNAGRCVRLNEDYTIDETFNSENLLLTIKTINETEGVFYAIRNIAGTNYIQKFSIETGNQIADVDLGDYHLNIIRSMMPTIPHYLNTGNIYQTEEINRLKSLIAE